MKIVKILFCFSLFILSSSLSYGQSWLWAKQCYGRGSNPEPQTDISSMATDKSGNIYVSGVYEGSVSFGTDTISSEGGFFLVKYAPNGNVIWVKNSESTLNGGGVSSNFIAIDKMNNICITGYYSNTITFDSITLTTRQENSFLIKYDSNGNVLWSRTATLTNLSSYDGSFSVAIDDSDYVYITGWFYGTITFGPFSLLNDYALNGNYSAFLTKYDSSGNVIWATNATRKPYGGSTGFCVATDHLFNVYITGNFNDTVGFDTVNLIDNNNEAQDVFFVKYNSRGIQQWAKQGYFPSNKSVIELTSDDWEYLAVDNSNNIYLTGTYADTIRFDSVMIKVDTSMPYLGAFLFKFTPGGNVLWGESSSPGGVAWTLSVDKCNDLYWSGTAALSPFSLGGYFLYPDSTKYLPACFVKLDSNGTGHNGAFVYNYNDDWDPITADPLGNNVYFSGDAEAYSYVVFGNDTLYFNPNAETAYLAKWNSGTILPCGDNTINSIQSENIIEGISLFPNPNNGTFTLSLSNVNQKCNIEIYDVMGEKVYTETLRSVQGDNEINISTQPNGVYFYRVISETGTLIGEGKIVIAK